MEEDNASSSGTHAHVVGVKSWIAYLGVLVLAAVLFGAVLPLTFMLPLPFPNGNEIAAAVVMAVSALIVGYRFMVYSGVLPWKKGLAGVKWRDMDEATFEQGFWSWISRSYTVRIGHRFTKASEIRLTNIGGGKDAVGTLNAKHQAMIRAGDGD